MSRNEKLLSRLLSVPNDFAWEELVRILSYFGYSILKNGKTGAQEENLRMKIRN